MPDGADLRWNGAQQAMLRELGCELLVLRGATEAAPAVARDDAARKAVRVRDEQPAPFSRAPRNNGAARARLVMLAPDAGLLRGPDTALARALLAALGVHEDEVRGEASPGVPAIAFGLDTPAETDVLRAPAFASLRDARAKRALWPALRALRRRLRDTRGG